MLKINRYIGIMKKVFMIMAVAAAMSAFVSCACSSNQEKAVEENTQPEPQCETLPCAACDSTYHCEE